MSFFVVRLQATHARIYESFDKLIEKSNNNNIHNKNSVPTGRECVLVCDEMRGRYKDLLFMITMSTEL